ncbi:urease accessory protein UreE [Citreimonas salinaria]|uniref:Urease accessory protein UreE n=1 Tax=Citreimonas salinaria TaxID=321339 RepID=A0A1H3HA88_9RHOB|nr:urease accessory protein UreE [Citreimonas salinaria]SDY12115.1 urease accessory protein [Citreimonas salinaria]
MLTARTYHPHVHGTPFDRLVLDYEARFLRRKVLTMASGAGLLVDLAQTTSLDDGGVLVTTEGHEIAVEAAAEPLLAITAPDLPRVAWHVGNRHTPCQIEAGRLLIRPDHVIRAMLEQLGATVGEVTEPFTPEGGAYGHGRTHGHDHSHSHSHAEAHGDAHARAHAAAHDHPHGP